MFPPCEIGCLRDVLFNLASVRERGKGRQKVEEEER